MAVTSRGVPGMKSDPPQFDLLVPRAPAVLSELVRGLGVNARLTHVPDHKMETTRFTCVLNKDAHRASFFVFTLH